MLEVLDFSFQGEQENIYQHFSTFHFQYNCQPFYLFISPVHSEYNFSVLQLLCFHLLYQEYNKCGRIVLSCAIGATENPRTTAKLHTT